MGLVFGDSTTCIKGVLNMMAKDGGQRVVMARDFGKDKYMYCTVIEWSEFVSKVENSRWIPVLCVNAIEFMEIIFTRYEDIQEASINASN